MIKVLNSYCIFCRTGSELKVAKTINALHKEFTAIAPRRIVQEKRNTIWQKRNLALLPGYVFLYLNNETEPGEDKTLYRDTEIDKEPGEDETLYRDIEIDKELFEEVREDSDNGANADIDAEIEIAEPFNDNIIWNARKYQKVRVTDMFTLLRQHEGGHRELLHEDHTYAQWIYKNHGTIAPSKVFEDGQTIRIIDGPLLDCHGRIVKLDKHKRRALVEFDFGGQKRIISLGIEIMNSDISDYVKRQETYDNVSSI